MHINWLASSHDESLLHGAVVHLLEVAADLPEVGDLSPAGLGGAGSADSVTFAQTTHRLAHSLKTKVLV